MSLRGFDAPTLRLARAESVLAEALGIEVRPVMRDVRNCRGLGTE